MVCREYILAQKIGSLLNKKGTLRMGTRKLKRALGVSRQEIKNAMGWWGNNLQLRLEKGILGAYVVLIP